MASRTQKRGLYIVIEGHDGTGKTTQANLLREYLESQGRRVISIKEPGGSPVCEAIRGVLLDGTLPRSAMTNTLLFTANRHELWVNVIEPTINQGIDVISTRNYWSTLAFQGYGEGMDLPIISAIASTFTNSQYMHPDVGIILTYDDLAKRKQRISQRGELKKPDTFESRPPEFQKRVEDGYREIAKTYGIPTIDASQSPESIQREVLQLIRDQKLIDL